MYCTLTWFSFSAISTIKEKVRWRVDVKAAEAMWVFRINISGYTIKWLNIRSSACISPKKDTLVGLTTYGEAYLYSLDERTLVRKLRTGVEGPFRPLKSCIFYEENSVAFAFAETPRFLFMSILRHEKSKIVHLERSRGRSWAPNASGMSIDCIFHFWELTALRE